MKCEMDLRSQELARECRFLKPHILRACILLSTLALLIVIPALIGAYADFLSKDNVSATQAIDEMSQKTASLEMLAQETKQLNEKYELIRRFENDNKPVHELLSLILDEAGKNDLEIKNIKIRECETLIIVARAASIVDAANFNQALSQYPAVLSSQVAGLSLVENNYSFTIESTYSPGALLVPVNGSASGGLYDQ